MMRGYRWIVLLFALAASLLAQDKRSRIDVQRYTIDAQINPRTQSLTATAKIEFTPLETANDVAFELNNALTVSKAVNASGESIATQRSATDFTVRVMIPGGVVKNQPTMVSLTYDGKLTGDEDSPVPGIRFAALHPDFGYLLYPARWFPVNNYSINRFAADLNITTPEGYHVVGSGDAKTATAADGGTTSSFHYEHTSFPGSIAIVKSEATRVSSQGINTQIYFRGEQAPMSQLYGDETGKIMTFFTGGVRPGSVRKLDACRNGSRIGKRLCGTGDYLPGPRFHYETIEYARAGGPVVAAMVGHSGVAYQSKSSVARKWPGALFANAV